MNENRLTPAQLRRYTAAYLRLTSALAALEEMVDSFPTPDKAADPLAVLDIDDLAAAIEALTASSASREDQPHELRDYLAEAEAIATEWYGRAGLEESHERNVETLATMATLHGVLGDKPSFAALRNRVVIYMVAAFQMGRAGANGDNSRDSE